MMVYRGEVGVGVHVVVSRLDPSDRSEVWSSLVDGTGLGVADLTGGAAITADGTVWVGHQRRNEGTLQEAVITPFDEAGTPGPAQRFDSPDHQAQLRSIVAGADTVFATVHAQWYDEDVGWNQESYVASTTDTSMMKTEAQLDFRGWGLAVGPEQDLVVVGESYSEPGEFGSDLVVARFDPNFAERWRTTYDSGLGRDVGIDVAVDDTGRIFAVGAQPDNGSSVDLWLGQIDPDGTARWSMTYLSDGFPENGRAVAPTPDGGVIVVGSEWVGAARRNGWAQRLDITP
jgi:hypothetical protein